MLPQQPLQPLPPRLVLLSLGRGGAREAVSRVSMSDGTQPAATYIREACERRGCRLPLVQLPCELSPLSRVPRRTGCWARVPPEGCTTRVSPATLEALNWTLIQRGGANRTACLRDAHAELVAQCLDVRTMRASLLHGEDHGGGILEMVHVERRRSRRTASGSGVPRSSCLATERALPFQTPRLGTCVSAGHEPPAASRYLNNHGHQAEVLIPILDESVMLGSGPAVLHWGWQRTHWVQVALSAMLPFTRLHTGRDVPSRLCRKYRPIGTGGGRTHWFRAMATAQMMRRAMERHCGLHERVVTLDSDSTPRERVVILLRGDTQQRHSGGGVPVPGRGALSFAERRPFADLGGLLRSVRTALPGASVRVATTAGNAPICTQARWVHAATILISAHGAHLTNALWLPRGALLVEVMPWGMWDYEGYRGLFRASGVAHVRIRSARPPPHQPHWAHPTLPSASGRPSKRAPSAPSAPSASLSPPCAQAGGGAGERGRQEHSQSRCAANEECRRFYRSCSALYFGKAQLCEALRPHVAAARLTESACSALIGGGSGGSGGSGSGSGGRSHGGGGGGGGSSAGYPRHGERPRKGG